MVDLVWIKGDSDSDLRGSIQGIRWDVFVCEQKVPFVLEIDARDYKASTGHLVAFQDGQAVGVLRVLSDGDDTYHVGRVSVLRRFRGQSLGRQLMEETTDRIKKRTPMGRTAKVMLDAQVNAATFYRKLGFEFTEKPPFMDAGIEHREMSKLIAGSRA